MEHESFSLQNIKIDGIVMLITLSVSTNTILKEKCEKNNIQNITDQLERLTPSQLEIAEDMLHKLIKAFALEE
jgi:hypothetical protein